MYKYPNGNQSSTLLGKFASLYNKAGFISYYKTDKPTAIKFKNTSHLIGDGFSLNDSGEC